MQEQSVFKTDYGQREGGGSEADMEGGDQVVAL